MKVRVRCEPPQWVAKVRIGVRKVLERAAAPKQRLSSAELLAVGLRLVYTPSLANVPSSAMRIGTIDS